MRTEHVGYDKLNDQYPSLFISYCRDDGRTAGLFAHRFRDEKELIERAKRAADRGVEKGVLEALEKYHGALGAPEASREALKKLGRGAAIVITGQQPSVGWGPLYNYYKANAVIRFAQAVEGRGVPCVAAFWNHSDDVRTAGSVHFPDRDNLLAEVPLPPDVGVESGTHVPLYEAGTPDALRLFASALADALPRTEFSAAISEFVKSTHRGSIAESFSRSLLGSLGPFGLIVLEPRLLAGERSEKFLADHLSAPDRLSEAVEEGRQAVLSRGFEDHLGRGVGLDLFEILDGRRRRVEKPGKTAGRLVPGVALRPIYQDAVLPTCASVGGPSEVGYQAALLPAYRALGVDPPVVFPRMTATLLEPKLLRLREKYGLSATDLFAPEEALGVKFLDREDDAAARIAALPDRVLREMEELTKPMGKSPAIKKARDKTAEKVRSAFEALSSRVKQEQGRQESTGRGHLSKFLTHVRPNWRLQERVITPLYYSSLHGADLLERLFPALDPFVFSHQVIGL